MIGGEIGIRTQETAYRRLLAFQTSAFNRSAISPYIFIDDTKQNNILYHQK